MAHDVTARLLWAHILGRPLIAYRYVEIAGVTITYYAMPFKAKGVWYFNGFSNEPITMKAQGTGGTGIYWKPLNAAAHEMELDL